MSLAWSRVSVELSRPDALLPSLQLADKYLAKGEHAHDKHRSDDDRDPGARAIR